MRLHALGVSVLVCCFSISSSAVAQSGSERPPQKVIFDTDIGDDIDDAFALGLLLRSPEFQVLGITSAWGDTELRARLVLRLLAAAGRSDIPVAVGVKTKPAPNSPFTQAEWASRQPLPGTALPDAIDFTLAQIRKYPGEITLISVAPLTNVGALIDRDPTTFHKLKRVIIMGGSVRKGYGDLGYLPDRGPDPEYNIVMDVPAAKKLFTSGVPLTVLPLDSTQLKLDEVKRTALFGADNPLTTAITTLYEQWAWRTNNPTPTLFDVLTITEAIDPTSCPAQPMNLQVDDKGYTREITSAQPNTTVCLKADADRVFDLFMSRLMHPPAGTSPVDLLPKTTVVTLALPANADWKGGTVTIESGGDVRKLR